MRAKCEKCHRVFDYPVDKWSWVRYRNSYRDKMVCPQCRAWADRLGAAVVKDIQNYQYTGKQW